MSAGRLREKSSRPVHFRPRTCRIDERAKQVPHVWIRHLKHFRMPLHAHKECVSASFDRFNEAVWRRRARDEPGPQILDPLRVTAGDEFQGVFASVGAALLVISLSMGCGDLWSPFLAYREEAGLVLIPKGIFTMGSPIAEANRASNETQHRVTLTTAFWMAESEVTQRQSDAHLRPHR